MLLEPIEKLLRNEDLSKAEVCHAVGAIMDGECAPEQIAAFLTALRMKGEKVDEITGAAEAMRSRMQPVQINASPLLDTCGTGGSGTGSFNISTATAFVLASCGISVAKHGNKAISSKSGSADVLGALGANLNLPQEEVAKIVEQCGIGFLFAPNHHPAMKHAGPIRKALGFRTLFNVLGPLTNPAGARYQLMGVYARNLLTPIAQVLGNLGAKSAWVVYGEDGVDEITLSGKTFAAAWDGEKVNEFEINPQELGLELCSPEALRGASPQENALRMKDILMGKERSHLTKAICLNAAGALVVSEKCKTLKTAFEMAENEIQSGKPWSKMCEFIELAEQSKTKITPKE